LFRASLAGASPTAAGLMAATPSTAQNAPADNAFVLPFEASARLASEADDCFDSIENRGSLSLGGTTGKHAPRVSASHDCPCQTATPWLRGSTHAEAVMGSGLHDSQRRAQRPDRIVQFFFPQGLVKHCQTARCNPPNLIRVGITRNE
jgi:hypothetical protein